MAALCWGAILAKKEASFTAVPNVAERTCAVVACDIVCDKIGAAFAFAPSTGTTFAIAWSIVAMLHWCLMAVYSTTSLSCATLELRTSIFDCTALNSWFRAPISNW